MKGLRLAFCPRAHMPYKFGWRAADRLRTNLGANQSKGKALRPTTPE